MQRISSRYLSCVVIALIVAACSQGNATGPTAPTSTGPATLAGNTNVALAHYFDPGATGIAGSPEVSCPTQAPRVALVGTLGLRIDFQWQPILNIPRYEVQARKIGTSTLVLSQVTEASRVEFYGEPNAQYEVRVRALTSCGTQGSWSNWIPLSVNDPLVPGYDTITSNSDTLKLLSVP